MRAVRAPAAALFVAACSLIGSPAPARSPQPIRVGYRSHLFALGRDGGVRRLTGGRTDQIEPRFCMGGRRIVDLGREVEVRAASDGHVLYKLPPGRGSLDGAAPSPDCRRVALVGYRKGGFLALLERGRRRRGLVHGRVGCGGEYPLRCPDWSPDGRTVYFWRNDGIASVGIDGGSPRQLIDDTQDAPRVSPSGRWLAFLRLDEDPRVDGLWIARSDGSDQRQLVHGSYELSDYGWIPGRDEVYAHGGGAGPRTLVVSPAGGRRRIGRRFHGGLVAVSPDGQRIAWTHERFRKYIQVRSSRSDGSGFRILASFASKQGYTDIDSITWSPDGSELLVEVHRHIGD